MKVIAIIQARMGSTRLPGKVMKEVLGKPLLEFQIERVKRSKFIDEIVIATTTKDSEQPIIDFCEKLFISYYRGSEEDVLSRYYEAATEYKADVVVRLTSDCPIIDPEIIDKVIAAYLNQKRKVDYVSNTLERTYPRGMDTEVFSYKILENVNSNAELEFEREHVTPYIYQNSSSFSTKQVLDAIDNSEYRLTIDTNADFLLINKIIKALYVDKPHFKYDEVVNLLERNRDWLKLNADISQKRS